MTKQLNLRLQEQDTHALDTAAAIIAGPSGAPYIGRLTVIRRALAAFNAQQGQPQQDAGQ